LEVDGGTYNMMGNSPFSGTKYQLCDENQKHNEERCSHPTFSCYIVERLCRMHWGPSMIFLLLKHPEILPVFTESWTRFCLSVLMSLKSMLSEGSALTKMIFQQFGH
jgi:hypothetical protein